MRSAYGEIEYDSAGRAIWAGGEMIGAIGPGTVPEDQTAGGTWVISDRDQLQLLIDTMMAMPEQAVGLDTEYEGTDRREDASPIGKARIVCTQFGWQDEELGKHTALGITRGRRVFLPNWGKAEDDGWLAELRTWLASPDHWKVGSFVFSTELHVFSNHGLVLNGIKGCGVRQSQTWRMGQVFEHGLKPLGEHVFGYKMRDYGDVFSYPRLKQDGTPYASNQRVEISLREAFSDPSSAIYASGLDYASLDAKVSVEGDAHMRAELEKMVWRRDGDVTRNLLEHYDEEWNPYQYIIAGMEDAGWPIDTEWMTFQHGRALEMQKELSKKLNQWAGAEVLWSSNPQKSFFLYGDTEKPEVVEKTIAGNPIKTKKFPVSPICKSGPTEKWDGTQKLSTDKVAVQWVRDHVRKKEDKDGLANLLLWTKVDKIRSSFLEPFPKWRDRWGMVHSRIGPEAGTNRLTVRQPPLQTMPQPAGDPFSVREGLMAQPEVFNRDVSRYMFQWMSMYGGLATEVDPESWVDDNLMLIGLDYSQLEMRILAHYLVTLFDDYLLAEDLAAGDLHAGTALRVWGSDPALKGLVAKDIKNSKDPKVQIFRNRGKIINFSVNYGKTAVGLGADIRDEDGEPIGEKAAEAILHQYFAAYPAILKYHKWAKRYVRQNGYVRTLGGRYRFLPSIRSPQRARQGEAERAALNTPIQGSAADIIVKAMLRSNTLPIPDLRRRGFFDPELYDYGARLVMQIHDELVWRVPARYYKPAMARIQYHMERPFDPEIPGFPGSGLPLPVTGSSGVTYLETK